MELRRRETWRGIGNRARSAPAGPGLAVVVLVVVACLGMAPVRGEEAQAAPSDPVAQEVIRLLAAGVPNPVVLRWLETSAPHPGVLAGDDLIALKQAGADAEVMRELLDLAAAGSATSAERPGGAAEPASAAAPPTVPAVTRTQLRIAYQPVTLEDEASWSLFVYLDGHPLAWAKAPATTLVTARVLVERDLAPGHHVLRVAEERHTRLHGDRGWRHAARMAPVALAFDLAPGEPARVRLELREALLGARHPGALSFTVDQGDRQVAELEDAGGEPGDWPPLCEELESGLTPGAKLPVPVERELGRCVRWADLWPPGAPIPSRQEIRDDLARQAFQPDLPGMLSD